MKKTFKRTISILLSILMIVGVFTIVPLSASAAVGDTVPEGEYLTFTAEEAGSSVTLKYTGGTLQYNENNSGWQSYTAGTQIALASAGDSVRFRGKNTTFNRSNHISLTGKVACSGNVMSLRLDDNGEVQGLSNYCFSNMFYGCAGLTAAPELPETTLADSCYESMFYGCTNLTVAPELPATALAEYCYSNMFFNCGNLTTAPELPATTLAPYCYYRMFYNCGRLTTAPELPATTLESFCYYGMFAGCSSIKLSETQNAEYGIPYRVPSGGNGTTASNALRNMFAGTGGTFTDGTPEINKTYYRPAKKYTVTWKNEDGTTLETDENVAEGATPTYDGEDPTKDDDDDYTYEFAGWKVGETTYGLSDALPQVTADVTYTAVFEATPKYETGYYLVGTMTETAWTIDPAYMLTQNPENAAEYMLLEEEFAANTEFKVMYVAPGVRTWFPDNAPNYTIAEDGTYSIFFRPDYQGGEDWFYNCIYVASPAPATYTVTWKNWDGDVLETDENVAEGSTPTYDGEAPTKAADAQNTYTFAAWDDGTTTYVLGVDDLPPVTGDVTYTAVFTADPITYTVTWKNWDGTVLATDEVAAGATPEYTGEEPTKRADRVYMYTFDGWDNEVVPVTGDAEYTAVFNSEEITVPHGPQDDGTFYWLGEKQKAYKLIEFEGDYYLVAEYNKYAKNQLRFLNASMVEGTDFAVGYYWFDADGKMTTLRNGPQADGCFYRDNERVNAYQLAEYEGNWYYICEYNKFAVNQRRYLNAATVEGTDFPAGYYDFDADGKMVIKNGPADDGYFYVNGVKQNAYKLVQYEGDWYFIAEYNKYAVNQRRYLNATVVEGTDFAAGYYYFGEDGEMTDEPEPEPAGKSLTKVTNENQIDEDNIGECTFEEAKAWILANWDDVMNTDKPIDVVYFVGTDLKCFSFPSDLLKQDFEGLSSDEEYYAYIDIVQSWFTEGEDIYLCPKAS